MQVEELLTKFGNWVIASLAAAFAYVAWREKTVSKVATLAEELKRMEGKIGLLEGHLEQRRTQDLGIITALAEIKAQLQNVTQAVAEIKAELRHKVDKE